MNGCRRTEAVCDTSVTFGVSDLSRFCKVQRHRRQLPKDCWRWYGAPGLIRSHSRCHISFTCDFAVDRMLLPGCFPDGKTGIRRKGDRAGTHTGSHLNRPGPHAIRLYHWTQRKKAQLLPDGNRLRADCRDLRSGFPGTWPPLPALSGSSRDQ